MQNELSINTDHKLLVNNLVGHSMNGGNSAFLNLVKIYLNDIYKTSFKLTLHDATALKLASNSIMNAWGKIKTFDREVDIKSWLLECVIETFNTNTKEFETKGLKPEEFFNLTPLEQKFLSLSIDERKAILCVVELDFSLEQSIALFPQMEKEEIISTMGKAFTALASVIEKGKVQYIPVKVWEHIIKISGKDELEKFLESRSITKDYELFIRQLRDIFISVAPPPEMAVNIRSKMLTSVVKTDTPAMTKSAAMKNVKARDIKRTITLRNKPVKSKHVKDKTDDKGRIKIKWKYVLIPLIFIAIAAVYYFLIYSSSDCEIRNTVGSYKINNEQTRNSSPSIGDIILTNEASELVVDFSKHGSMKLNENSSIQIIRNERNYLKIKIIKGNIDCSFLNSQETFKINEKMKIELSFVDGTIYVNNSDFNINYVSPGSMKVEVKRGYLKLEDSHDYSYYLGTNYAIEEGAEGYSLPYNINSDQTIAATMKRLTYTISADQLMTVLNRANERDLLTLWHLIPRTSQVDRSKLISKINEYAHIPYEDIERKAVQLDTEAMLYLLNLVMINYLQ